MTKTAIIAQPTNTTLLSITRVLGTPPTTEKDIKLDITTTKPKPTQDNLTVTERQAIGQLKQRQDIIIKPADKGSGTVVMDKTWYIDECNRQLTDTKFYQHLDEDITADIQKRVTFYVNRMHKDKLINDKTKQYLIQSDVKPGRFYILPKVHKPGNPGRPIVSSNSHPTERLSHFVDYYLQPLVHKLPSFVKDTNDFLNKLLTMDNLPANSLLVTLDVSKKKKRKKEKRFSTVVKLFGSPL